MFKRKSFKGGITVPHNKNTSNCETITMPVPSKVVIPMSQHIGAPCNPIVKKGDLLKVGQLIGEPVGFVSSPIHSSVSGVVTALESRLFAGGYFVDSLVIETDGKQEIHESIKPPTYSTKEEFVELIKNSGLVGLGGAGFPVFIKLNPPKDKIIDTLIVNFAECEPYITSDMREVMECSSDFLKGLEILCETLNIPRAVIGIEDNKKEAFDLLNKQISNNEKFEVALLDSRYPQGAEKMLIAALTGRKVPVGKLPSDYGVIVLNVNSVSFIPKFLKTGMPLIKKRITVDGPSVKTPSNIEVLIGTSLQDVFEFCGGFKTEPEKIVMGGPMMGIAQFSLENTIVKHTNALLAFDSETAKPPKATSCIRCGRCVNGCPMDLLPLSLHNNTKQKNIEQLQNFRVNDCVECGCCTFICPAKIHLVQSIRVGKSLVKNAIAKGVN